MKQELDDLLCKKFPKLFRDRHADAGKTCMCWGFDCEDGWFTLIDVLCTQIQTHIDWTIRANKSALKHNAMVTATRAGDMAAFDKHTERFSPQWKADYLKEVLDSSKDDEEYSRGIQLVPKIAPQVVVVQVKEKFAGLRFYVDGGDETIETMIRFAEALSTRTCEVCGAPGTVGGKGWIKTHCDAHRRPGEEDTYGRKIEWTRGPFEEDTTENNG